MAFDNDFFWWLESVARSLEFEDIKTAAWADEVLDGHIRREAASKRQERLTERDNILREIGFDHHQAIKGSKENCEAGGLNGFGAGTVPHEHGGNIVQKSLRGEPCDFEGCTLGSRAENQNGSWPAHEHDTPLREYQEQSQTVAKVKDGFEVKRLRTLGDMKYEGTSMGNCIGQDADRADYCDECEGSGYCRNCDSDGQEACYDCDGTGKEECENCEGYGTSTCGSCGGGYESQTRVSCHTCSGKGKYKACDTCGLISDSAESHHTSTGLSGGAPHEWKPQEKDCGTCAGSGQRWNYTQHEGQVECDDCLGTGESDEEDEETGEAAECGSCDGFGYKDCDDCGGSGNEECGVCEGEGKVDHETCGGAGNFECSICYGSGECQTCHGNTSDEYSGYPTGPANYYHAFSKEHADNFDNSPGGALSLRDKDNIPHVSFLHGRTDERLSTLRHRRLHGLPSDGGEEDPMHIHDVLGRGNKIPSSEHQHRMLEYMKTKFGDESQPRLPGMEDNCGTCKGKGKIEWDYKKLCTNCEGNGGWRVDHPTLGNHWMDCPRCEGSKQVPDPQSAECTQCKGTGNKTARVGWGYGGTRHNYTEDDISNIVSGNMPRPEVMMVARHKENTNKVEMLHSLNDAKEFARGDDIMPQKIDCGQCDATGRVNRDEDGSGGDSCRACSGQGQVIHSARVPSSETHDLFAIPSMSVNKDSMIYRPSDEKWEIKSGRGSRIPFEDAGAKIPWEALNSERKTCNTCEGQGLVNINREEGKYGETCGTCDGDGAVDDFTDMKAHRDRLPEFAQTLFPRVARNQYAHYEGWK